MSPLGVAQYFASELAVEAPSDSMVSVRVESAIDLELQRDLERALQDYLLAAEPEKAEARADYHAKLDAFSARVLDRQPFTTWG